MQGDSIIIEEHHRKAARGVYKLLVSHLKATNSPFTITIAGESGSGKSEIAAALAEELKVHNFSTIIFQQDDYFVHPPKTNDLTRRQDINWVGLQEVHLKLLDEHLRAFIDGKQYVNKPLISYADDAITQETLEFHSAQVAIAEGTYTSSLENVNRRIFIDRNYMDTKKHRELRMRDSSELDEFIDSVLSIEHNIISTHKRKADIIINKNYSVIPNS